MGWRSKFIFLMIIYFSGFATAIYYLAPSGPDNGDSGSYVSNLGAKSSSRAGTAMNSLCDKAFAKASSSFSGMTAEDFKEKFNLGLKSLIDMSKNSSASRDDDYK